MFKLRSYQQEAVDAAIAQLKSSTDPFIIEAAGGAGKSVIVAEIARIIHQMTGKRILCTAPTADLVIQNRAKYAATGNPCSMFSASAGQKSLRHPVIFGTPLTIKNRISSFKNNFAMIVIDECDLITPTMRAIIDEMRQGNPNLRVCGLTATPYRTGTGYIFSEWADGTVNGADMAVDPYFVKCVYRIQAHELIEMGFLTPPLIGAINTQAYDTGSMKLNGRGQFDAADVDRAYHGHGRKTSLICGDFVAQSQDRNGVLIYAATVRHAEEVMASLPPELSALITGESKNRQEILKQFAARKIKYVVNVGVLTVGVDMPHVDVIAILRKMESIRLFQQILYRGTRLHDEKDNFLILDYGGNVETHTPDGDVFKPIVKTRGPKGPGIPIEAECPDCGYINEFSLNPEYADFQRDKYGYSLDVFGAQMMTEYGPVASHYGRRCCGMVRTGQRGEYERCNHRYNSKECPQCSEALDIAARECNHCGCQVVDPNDSLVAEFVAAKKDPHVPSTEVVVSYDTKDSVSQKGNRTLRVDFVTSHKQFSVWLMPEPNNSRAANDWRKWEDSNGDIRTISYVKDRDTNFYRVLAYNMPEDDLPDHLKDRKEVAKLRKFA